MIDTLNSDKLNEFYSGVDSSNTRPTADRVLNEAYKKSGSKLSFRDWLKTNEGKGVVNEFTKLISAWVNPNQNTNQKEDTKDTKGNEEDDKPKSEIKILGMSPVTFGIVSLGVIAAVSIIAVVVIKNKK